MLRIRTTVNNENIFLDLYKNEPVVLSLSFAELQDITKKNSNFSKAFSLPGSKTNNTVFNFFYELNSIPTTFDPNNKFNASLLWDGYEIMTGYIRLNGVTISNGEIIYQVTFYNQVGDLMANIGDKFLYDLDLSCLQHPYSIDVVLQSQVDYNLFPLTGTTNYSYQNGKTMWGLYNIGYQYTGSNTTVVDSTITPLVQFTQVFSGGSYNPIPGNFDYSGTPVHDFYFKPSIQIKELYTQIVNQAGYNVQSEFFDTAYFQRYYMPLKFVDETVYSRNAIPACFTYANDSYGELNPTPARAYTNPTQNNACNSLGWPTTIDSFTIDALYQGIYQFHFTYTIQPLYPCDDTSNFYAELYYTDGTQTKLLEGTYYYCNGSPQQISFVQKFQFTGTTNVQFYFQGEGLEINGFSFEVVNGPRFIPNGAIIDYAIEFPPNDYKQIDFITSINKLFNLVVVPNPDIPNNLIVEPIVDYIGKGNVIDWTSKVNFDENQSLYPTSTLLNGTLEFEYKLDQDYANQDFNGQTNRIFGTDKFLLNQQYKDQTTKFEFTLSSPMDITINNSVVSELTLNSMSKLKQIDVSGITQQTFVPFKILPKTVFRGLTLPNDNYGFVQGGTFGSGSTNCTSGITVNVTKTGYIRYNDCDGNQVTWFLPHLGFDSWNGCLDPSSVKPAYPLPNVATFTITSSGTPCGQYFIPATYQNWYMDGIAQDRFTNINRFTTYPFNYNNFSHYINYRGEDQSNITPSEYVFQSEDLYNIYYQPYVNDIINEENKIYSCKIYLYPQDIERLRWNEKIIINNTYFRINKITNFNALEPDLCDVELVKLTKQYSPHRRLYYELIPCAGGPHRYSHSDLMYNLYAYAGNYVKLFSDDLNYLGCYEVAIDTYDPLHTYEHYYLSSGFTPNLVGVYPDCGCTGRTPFNVVQQSACTVNYFWYTGVSCSDSATTYTFKSEDSNLDNTSVYKIENSGTTQDVCVFNVNSSFIQNTDWIQILSAYTTCEACFYIPPTPSPTMTPSSVTPTPTPTPTETSTTPTPTPTVTPTKVVCLIYDVYNGAEAPGDATVNWIDCNGFTQDYILPPGQNISFCAKQGTVYLVGGDGGISGGSEVCIQPTPTPTPTPSQTPDKCCPFIYIANSSLDVSISNVYVEGEPATLVGGVYPNTPGNGTTLQAPCADYIYPSYFTLYLQKSSGVPGQRITVTDSNGNAQCQSFPNGTAEFYFDNVYMDCNRAVEIFAEDGTC
jgi:hypothetical protein